MKNITKTALALSVSAVMSGSIFAACSADIDMGGQKITNAVMTDNATQSEVATKAYVDAMGNGDVGSNYGIVVNNKTGKAWLDRNVGATTVCAAVNGADSCKGSLFQWGRSADGHQCARADDLNCSAISGTVDGAVAEGGFADEGDAWSGKFIKNLTSDWRTTANTTTWSGAVAENNVCPSGFRVPTNGEFNQERATWATQNGAGAFGSDIKFAYAGYRTLSTGALASPTTNGYYWSSTIDGSASRYLRFNSGLADMFSNSRGVGFSVRCIKD